MASAYSSFPVEYLRHCFDQAEYAVQMRLENARKYPKDTRLYKHMQACRVQMAEVVKVMEERQLPETERYRDRLENAMVIRVMRLMEKVQKRMLLKAIESKEEESDQSEDSVATNAPQDEVAEGDGIFEKTRTFQTIRSFCHSIDLGRSNAVSSSWNIGSAEVFTRYCLEIHKDVQHIWDWQEQSSGFAEPLRYSEIPSQLSDRFDRTLSKQLDGWIDYASYRWGVDALQQLEDRSRNCLHGRVIVERFRPTLQAFVRFKQIDFDREDRHALYVDILSCLLKEGRKQQALVFIRKIMQGPVEDIQQILHHFLIKNEIQNAACVAQAIDKKAKIYQTVIFESMVGDQLDVAERLTQELTEEARDLWTIGMILARTARNEGDHAKKLAQELASPLREENMSTIEWIENYYDELTTFKMQGYYSSTQMVKKICKEILELQIHENVKKTLGIGLIRQLLAHGKRDVAIELLQESKTFHFCETYADHLIREAVSSNAKHHRKWKFF